MTRTTLELSEQICVVDENPLDVDCNESVPGEIEIYTSPATAVTLILGGTLEITLTEREAIILSSLLLQQIYKNI